MFEVEVVLIFEVLFLFEVVFKFQVVITFEAIFIFEVVFIFEGMGILQLGMKLYGELGLRLQGGRVVMQLLWLELREILESADQHSG